MRIKEKGEKNTGFSFQANVSGTSYPLWIMNSPYGGDSKSAANRVQSYVDYIYRIHV